MNDHKNFEQLCSLVLEGRATEAELTRFKEILRNDAPAREAYREQSRIHALLTFQNGIATTHEKTEAEPANIITHRRWHRPNFVVIAAALAIFLGVLGWLVTRENDSRNGIALEIVSADEQTGFTPGQITKAEKLVLTGGALSFRLESGALVKANAPAEIHFQDAMHLTVIQGAITVDVGDQAKGFVVDTENARVVDLGTRFGVAVGEDETDVVVFEGEVDVFKPNTSASTSRLANLRQGEGVRVDSYWVAKRLEAVEIRGESLAIMGGNGSKPATITRVSDDINDVGFHRFYSIHPKAMREGMLAYSTHGMPRWTAMPNESFPGRLRGADTVRTFSPDSKNTNLNLTIELSEPCDVFILLDTRSEPPAWLADRFKKTPHQLRSGPWKAKSRVVRGIEPDPNGKLFVNYSVWRTRVHTPGNLTLGPPRGKNEPVNRAMYGIAVKKLPPSTLND